MTIKKALQTIKGYCEKHLGCSICPLSNYGQEECAIADKVPTDWNAEEILKKRRGDADD